MEQFSPNRAPIAVPPPDGEGVLWSTGRALLVAAIPLSLVWYPLARIPGVGNVTVGDIVLIALWGVSAIGLLLGGVRTVDARSATIAALGLLVAALAGAGAKLVDGPGLLEFLDVMKRFGVASVIPLGTALFRSRRLGAWIRYVTAGLAIAMALFMLLPELRAYLPVSVLLTETEAADRLGERHAGLVTNPNDLAYAAICLAILHAALVPLRLSPRDRILLLVTVLGSGASLVGSASRSGMLGAGGALVFLLLSRAMSRRTKITLAFGAALLAMAGVSTGGAFRERFGSLYQHGVREGNVQSRLEMQWICLQSSLRHPLGVGFRGIERATSGFEKRSSLGLTGSDNVYVDTLLASGVFGLLCLVAIFVLGWKNVARRADGRHRGVCLLRSGIVAFLLFGTASVIPLSVFLSPAFFSLLAAGAYLDLDDLAR